MAQNPKKPQQPAPQPPLTRRAMSRHQRELRRQRLVTYITGGAIGLALFVAALAAAAWRFAGYARSRDDALALTGIAGLAILAGVVVKNLTDDFFYRTNARFLWTMLALLVAFGERRLREGSGGSET